MGNAACLDDFRIKHGDLPMQCWISKSNGYATKINQPYSCRSCSGGTKVENISSIYNGKQYHNINLVWLLIGYIMRYGDIIGFQSPSILEDWRYTVALTAQLNAAGHMFCPSKMGIEPSKMGMKQTMLSDDIFREQYPRLWHADQMWPSNDSYRDNDAQSVNLGSPNFQPIPFCADLAFKIEWIRTPNKTWWNSYKIMFFRVTFLKSLVYITWT